MFSEVRVHVFQVQFPFRKLGCNEAAHTRATSVKTRPDLISISLSSNYLVRVTLANSGSPDGCTFLDGDPKQC